jgi:hypothetical protein
MLLERTMAGRPKKNEADRKRTGTIRVSMDIAKMIGWICQIRNSDVSDLVDPILRGPITMKYMELLPALQIIKRTQDEALAEQGLPPTEDLPNVIHIPLTDDMDEDDVRERVAEVDAEAKGKKKGKK